LFVVGIFVLDQHIYKSCQFHADIFMTAFPLNTSLNLLLLVVAQAHQSHLTPMGF
jgi:hypothetical protein